MGYQRKPNYHFSDKNATGIDKVPAGRVVIIEDYEGDGSGEVKQFIKRKNDGITATTTIHDAVESSGDTGLSSEDSVKANTMTEAEFNALAEQRRQQYAGSGYVTTTPYAGGGAIGIGQDSGLQVYTAGDYKNFLYYGGDSRYGKNSVNVNGIILFFNDSNGVNHGRSNEIFFPEAPKGSKPAALDITDTERKSNFFFISDATDSDNEPKANAKYIVGDRVLYTNDMYECIADDTSGDNLLTNNSYYKKLSSPILSRQDLVFLEVWHELVDEKDIVYPAGNVQHRGTDTDGLSGLANGTFTGADTYSLFGNWQEAGDLIGKGYVWSNLSEADKVKFVSNPENNVYLSKDGYVQVRYRVRVVEGFGNDWSKLENYFAAFDTVKSTILPKGSLVNNEDFSKFNVSANYYLKYEGTQYTKKGNNYNIGSYTGRHDSYYNYNDSYGFTVPMALPIALVQRRNQGAFDDVFNAEGSSNYLNVDGETVTSFYDTDNKATSIADTFNPTKVTAGNIGTTSGRPDYLFYDEINERDVEDLRMSAHKVTDVQGYLYDQFNNAIKGQIRGKDKLQQLVAHYTCDTDGATNGSGRYVHVNTDSITEKYSIFNLKGSSSYMSDLNGSRKYTAVISHPDVGIKHYKNFYAGNYYIGRAFFEAVSIDTFANKSGVDVKIYGEVDHTYNNHSLVCNIIGDVVNYPSEWNENGIIGIPVLSGENGETYLEMSEEDGKGFGLSSSADAYNDYNNYSIKLPKKSLVEYLVLVYRNGTWTPYSRDNSLSHNSDDSQNTYGLDGKENRLAFHKNILESDNGLVVIFYKTHSDNTIPTSNQKVLTHGDVMVSNYNGTIGHGSLLASNLIGVVNTGAATTGQVSENKNLQNVTINSNQTFITTGWSITNHPLSHNPVSIVKTSKRIAKFVPYLTKASSTFKMVLLYKDVIWDDENSNWGDNDRFDISSGPISYSNDDNGTRYTFGQKYINLPNFID